MWRPGSWPSQAAGGCKVSHRHQQTCTPCLVIHFRTGRRCLLVHYRWTGCCRKFVSKDLQQWKLLLSVHGWRFSVQFQVKCMSQALKRKQALFAMRRVSSTPICVLSIVKQHLQVWFLVSAELRSFVFFRPRVGAGDTVDTGHWPDTWSLRTEQQLSARGGAGAGWSAGRGRGGESVTIEMWWMIKTVFALVVIAPAQQKFVRGELEEALYCQTVCWESVWINAVFHSAHCLGLLSDFGKICKMYN